tara:strand:+ start:709 stop:1041 length:333 start_codon:yes stop_codon:yes gene_type:complete
MATYLVKDDSKKFIQEELINLLDLGKRFFVSLKSLIEVLIKYSFSSDPIEEITAESSELKEQSLKIVDPIEAVESTGTIPSMKMVEEDTELSSFSPELVEVITEEEEKVA